MRKELLLGDRSTAVSSLGNSSKYCANFHDKATDPLRTRTSDSYSQFPERNDQSVQVTPTKSRYLDTTRKAVYCCKKFVFKTCSKSLLSFLDVASKEMWEELITESHAFVGYDLLHDESPRQPETIEHICRLNWKKSLDNMNLKKTGYDYSSSRQSDFDKIVNANIGLEVTGVDWDAEGFIIAASYGERNEVERYRGQGALVLWDISSENIDFDRPIFDVEHDSSLCCIATHPEKHKVVASGSENGELLVYDFNRDDPLVALSTSDEYRHSNTISCVLWHWNISDQDWNLYSISEDGKMLIWSLANNLKYPVRGFTLVGGCEGKAKSAGSAGALILEKSTRHQSIIYGSDCGSLVQATVKAEQNHEISNRMRWSTNAKKLLSNVSLSERERLVRRIEDRASLVKRRDVDVSSVFEIKPSLDSIYPLITVDCMYKSHHGRITSVDIQDDMILSCAEDGALFVSRIGQGTEPVLVINSMGTKGIFSPSLKDAKFCPGKATLIAVGSENGSVLIYNIESSTRTPFANITLKEKENPSISSLQFNKVDCNLLAVGDNDGVINIWRLPMSLKQNKNRNFDGGNLVFRNWPDKNI